jgi:copper resistance protein B
MKNQFNLTEKNMKTTLSAALAVVVLVASANSTARWHNPTEGKTADHGHSMMNMKEMDHSKMSACEHAMMNMKDMDHSKMSASEHSKMTGCDDSEMEMKGMDHSKMDMGHH